MPKRNAKYSEKSNESGKVDEADTIQEIAGAKTAAFGLAIDSIGRANPTHMLPLHVRQTLARWWSNTPGNGVNGAASGAGTLHDILLNPEHIDGDGKYQNLQYSWYEPSIDGSVGPMETTVAAQLAVTVGEAEQLVNGTPDGGNSFLEYCDVPMNQQTLDRLSYWAYDQSAIEFDPNYQFEAQMVGVDAFSQLFVECMDFHFHFLAVLDQEYHRLRSAGPLGVMDDSRHTSAWYSQYHFWRDEIEAAYLETGAVELPTGLRGANWTIADVLTEILRMMVGADGSLLPDIKLSLKGLVKAKSGSSLGIYTDPSMLDADGNVRFYQPAWRTESIAARGKGNTPNVVGGDRSVSYPYITVGQDDLANDVQVTFAAPYEGESAEVVGQSASTVYWDNQIQSFAPTLEVLASQGRLPRWARADPLDPESGLDAAIEASSTYWTTAHSRPQMYFCDLPKADGVLTGRDGQGDVAYWRGDQLNLVDMIAVARRLGRVLEPEVCNGFLPAMGMVTGMDQLLSQPMSLNARMYDDLINLYTSSFMYNENPVRTYTAAHLGPIDRGVSSGELNVGDHQLHTEETAEDGTTTTLTVREKYWTPPTIQGADAKAETLAFFVPNGVMESDLIGDIPLTSANVFLDHIDPVLFGRLFGDTNSMLTKVERPVVMPAGIAEPESTYASGVGLGAVQMLVELQASVFGGEPYVGLGHNGFVDWQVDRSAPSDHPHRHFPFNRAAMTQGTYQGYTLYQGPTSEDGNMETEGLYNYTAAEAIASRTLAFVGLDPLGISLAADFLLDDVHDVGEAKSMSLWPVGCDAFNSDSIAGMTTRISSETASVAQFNILRNSIPSDLQWGMFGAGSGVIPVGPNHVDLNGNPAWLQFDPAYLSTFASVVGSVLDQGVTNAYMARVPQSITYTKGGTSHTVNLGYTAADLMGTVNSKLFGPGNLFSKTLANGLKVWEGTDTTLPFATDDGAGTAVVENIIMRDFDANTQLPSTDSKKHTSLLQLNLTPHDLALSHFQDIPYDVQSALLSGTNEMTITFEIELMALGISTYNGDPEAPAFTGTGFEPLLNDEYTFIHECGIEDAVNIFGANVANGTLPNYRRDFKLTWDDRERNVADLGIEISFDRDQIASETVRRHATLRSVSRSVLTPLQNNSLLYQEMANGGLVGLVPLGLSTDTELTAAGNWVSMIDTIHAVAYNPRESPGGAWGNMNIDIDSKRSIVNDSPVGAFPIGPMLLGTASLNNAATASKVSFQQAMAAKYDTCATWRTFFDAHYGFDHDNILYNYLYFGVNREANFWSEWGDVGFDSYHGSSTVWHYYPDTWGQAESIAWWQNNGISDRGISTLPTSSVTLCAGNPSSVSYVIPDDPDHRMIYRPYRTLVDAAVAKELKQLLVPTHERYDGVGGPLGLPFYGTTTPFRFSQLAFDAGLPDQFLLEPAASKARMINSANRGMLTFGKLALLDTDTQRHVISPILREMNNAVYLRGQVHAGGVTGTPIYTRDLIRDIQYGRQLQNL